MLDSCPAAPLEPCRPSMDDPDVCASCGGGPDWSELERDYWRYSFVVLLRRRSVLAAFEALTSHAPRASFVFDSNTHCMRRTG